MAPEDTSTVSPSRDATTSTSESTRVRSSPPVAVVSDDEPTLTTTRRAVRTASRTPTILRCRCPAVRTGSHTVVGCGLRGAGTRRRRADPARPGDVVRGDRRLARQGRPASGGYRDGPVRRPGALAPGGHRERPAG